MITLFDKVLGIGFLLTFILVAVLVVRVKCRWEPYKRQDNSDSSRKVDEIWMLSAKTIRRPSVPSLPSLYDKDDFHCNWETDVHSHYTYFMDGLGWPEVKRTYISHSCRCHAVQITFASGNHVWFWDIPNQQMAIEFLNLFESKGEDTVDAIISRARSRKYQTGEGNLEKYGYCWPEVKYVDS